MLVKMTSKNQITLPKAVVTQVAATEYFEVEVKDGRIVLTSIRMQQAGTVREKQAGRPRHQHRFIGAVQGTPGHTSLPPEERPMSEIPDPSRSMG